LRRPALAAALALSFVVLAGAPCLADRIVLAPTGTIVNPNALRVEYFQAEGNARRNLGRAAFGVPGQLIGLELEVERAALDGRTRETFGFQYSPTGNLLADLAPALSFGVRDVLRRGRDGQAVFVSLTKSVGLSVGQERLLRSFRLHAGYGTSRLGGAFVGMSSVLRLGATVAAEYVAGDVNASLSVPLPLVPGLQARAYTLDGTFFFGAALTLSR
jgi:hypothetical protein